MSIALHSPLGVNAAGEKAQVSNRDEPSKLRDYALFGVKAFHSLAFWTIQSAIFYLLYKGARRQTDRRAAAAFAIAAGESLIYAGNGFRCPLTKLAEDLGAERGSVTDIFLPKWLAANIARIYVPLFAIGIYLHLKNLFEQVGADQVPQITSRD